jgi:superkiller protein 3
MASPVLNAALKAAELAIADSQYKDALQHCKAALKADKRSVEALLLIGEAAFHLKEYEQSELAYRRALETKPGLLDAWQGLAEVFAASGNIAGEIEANERLVSQSEILFPFGDQL